MANNENLKKGKDTQFSTGELQARIAAEGGKKKAENAKEEKKEQIKLKSAKEALVAAMEIMTLKLTEEAINQKQKDMAELLKAAENPLIAQLVNIIFNKSTAPLTKLKALDMAFDRMEGKPKQSGEQDINLNLEAKVIYISSEEDKEYDNHIDEVINDEKKN